MTESDHTESGLSTMPFSVSPSAHARVALRLYAGRWWPLALLPPLACLIAAAWNVVFLVVALIWILLLLPPAVLAVYFSLLLHPSVAVMVRPHTVTFSKGKLVVDFPREPDSEDERICTMSILHSEIESVSEISGYLVIIRRDGRRSQLLMIPMKMLPVGFAGYCWS